MKLTALEVDHKEVFDAKEIGRCLNEVGGARCLYEFIVSMDVGSRIVYLSSHPLDLEDMTRLWEAGDLAVCDDVWEGTFAEIIIRLANRMSDNYEEDIRWAKNAGL